MKNFLSSSILLFVGFSCVGQCDFLSDNSGASCENATALCPIDLLNLRGTLPSMANTNAPSPLCPNDGEADNIMWYKFFACEESIELQITPENCTIVDCDSIYVSGMQAGLYRNCNVDDIIACSIEGNVSTFTLSGNGLVPGELVFLFLDGYKGSVCDYEITALSGIDTSFVDIDIDSLAMPEDGGVTGDDVSCIGFMAKYSFDRASCVGSGSTPRCLQIDLFEQNLLCYEWIIEPSEGWEFVGDSTTVEIEINWLVEDTFQINVIEHRDPILNICGNGTFDCGDFVPLTVAILPPVVEFLPPILLCEGERIEYCGEVITTSTTVTCEVDSCQFEVQDFIFLESVINNLGTILFCSRTSCYELYGVDYCDSGSYSVINPNSQCQEIVEFTLVDFQDFQLQLVSSNDIDCTDRSSSLSAQVSMQGYNVLIDYSWADQFGNPLSNSADLIVREGGTYNCMATIPGINCEISSSILVNDNSLEVTATFNYDTINCEQTESILSYAANQNITSHRWSDRIEFHSQLPNPSVAKGGLYYVTLTASNGCQLTDQFTVPENKEVPDGAFLPVGDWECETEQMELHLTIPNNEVLVDWQTTDGLIAESSNTLAVISKPGLYEATLYHPLSHCTALISANIDTALNFLQDFEFEKTDVYCNGANNGQITLTNIQGGIVPLTLLVDGIQRDGGLSVDALGPGLYGVELLDNKGCIVQKEIEILEFPEAEIILPSEIAVVYETAQNIQVQLSQDRTIAGVVWTDLQGSVLGTEANLQVNMSEDTPLKVEVTDNHGCVLEQVVQLKVSLADEVYVPNIFSPNGDGSSDFFTAFSVKSPGLIESLTVYDRWGNTLYIASGFELGDEGHGWDGTYEGRQLMPGVYIYSLTIDNGAGELVNIYGDVTLIR